MPHPYTEADALTWINICDSPENQRASGPWTAEHGAQGPMVTGNYTIAIAGEACGSVGLDWTDPSDIYFRNVEVGYWLGEEHWGKGYMGVIIPAFIDWTWRTFGFIIRINAEISANNVGSRKCLEKAGLVVEGRKKMSFIKNGVLGDTILLGMIRPGFEHEG
jgi:[ribosomal protein S5]-alanine N-acetyltransferase